jgi:ribosomal protein S18 acetylase RimI-like enzyme
LPLVFRLAVKESHRKKGIGTLLLKEATKRLKAHGHTEIALLVDNKDQDLKDWYYKQDFKTGTELVCL